MFYFIKYLGKNYFILSILSFDFMVNKTINLFYFSFFLFFLFLSLLISESRKEKNKFNVKLERNQTSRWVSYT